MKKMLVMSLFALCTAAFAAENLVAHWDFSKGINSVDGKYKMRVRGDSSIAATGKEVYLKVVDNAAKSQGVVTQQVYPALSPKAFRAEVKFRITQTPKKGWMFLLDSKYITGANKTPNNNKGFFLFLAWNKNNKTCYPCGGIGLGNTSIFMNGAPFAVELNKVYTLTFSYNGKDTVEYKVDGKVNKVISGLKGGPVAPAYYTFSIGDRYSGSNFPLSGDILDVKLFSLDVAK